MRLEFSSGHISVTGAVEYNAEPKNQKYVGVLIGVSIGGHPTEAVVDTGAAYLICSPDLAKVAGLGRDAPLVTDETILFRGQWIKGDIHHVELYLYSDDDKGNSISLMVQTFIPHASENLSEVLPYSSLGWIGCLESIPFAIDSGRRVFYFG